MSPTAVVTGTSSGIGLATATRLVEDGWHVIGLSRSRGPLPAAADWVRCDLSAVEAVEEALLAVRSLVGGGPSPLAGIVHAAGLQHSARLGDLDAGHGELMWSVHVRAAEALVNGLVTDLADDGRVVLVGSRTMTGVPGKSQYAATKAALAALARAWASELASRRITVNVVAPGPTQTPMLDDPNRAATPPKLPALGRLIAPAEVADLTAYLLGRGGAMITGQTLVMCGGASLDPA